jgi:hypothetical protein
LPAVEQASQALNAVAEAEKPPTAFSKKSAPAAQEPVAPTIRRQKTIAFKKKSGISFFQAARAAARHSTFPVRLKLLPEHPY